MQLASLLSWRGKRLILLAVLIIITLITALQLRKRHISRPNLHVPWLTSPPADHPDTSHSSHISQNRLPSETHPIDHLINTANRDFHNVLSRETFDLHNAAVAYRHRRGRHPPPHFARWYEFAKKHNAVMIEDLFDQIYHDIEPFWGIAPQQIRDSVHGLQYRISIRNGKLDKPEDKRYRVNFWHEMFQEIAEFLPDLDLAFNIMDEPRLLVHWEMINTYVKAAAAAGRLDGSWLRGVQFLKDYPSYPPFDESVDYEHEWTADGPYWDLVKRTCDPTTLARHTNSTYDFSSPPIFPSTWPNGSYEGYVANWTVAKDPCSHPHLRNLHGTFIEPISLLTSKSLFPMFGGSKLPNNNEILLPAPRYWTTEAKFTGSNFWSYFDTVNDWAKKKTALVWRGVASGGRSRADTWTHYQRHRFVSMLNSSQVARAQNDDFEPANIPTQDAKRLFNLSDAAHLPRWIRMNADAAFTNLECFPMDDGKHCPYTDPYYNVANEIDMYKMYDYRYLPDIDGNSFSGRYRAFLLSSSLPIKATIYSEWHDSRLWAWKHFVPMDNTFVDLYGIMEYFLGYDDYGGSHLSSNGHDEKAKKIALDGRSWAEKVLRKEDMLVYIYRLMLEYARVSSDRRDIMGYVADI